jgi:hypothetical protein
MYRAMILVAISISCLGVAVKDTLATPFQNLDFESANITHAPPYSFPISQALPHWSAVVCGTTWNSIWYDNMALDGAGVSIHDGLGAIGPDPLWGQYSVLLQTPSYFAGQPPTLTTYISQTATVPEDANSFWCFADYTSDPDMSYSHLFVSLNGVEIPMMSSGNTYRGAITAYAGQEVELRIGMISDNSAYHPINLLIDHLFFADVIVPEPSTIVLLCTAMFGLLCYGLRRRCTRHG